MLRVLGIPASSNVQKVTWLLTELDVPFVREDFGGKAGQSIKSAPYTDLNPNGTIPTLVDGDLVLWESNSICRYLARKANTVALYPEGLQERALCERWMDWQLGTLRPWFHPLFRILIRRSGIEQETEAIVRMRDTAARAFAIMEHALSTTDYLGGSGFALAEIATAVWAHRWFVLKLDRGETPRLERWYRRLCERPAFVAHVVDAPFE
ncbi:MAG: glutathione S-transferase family protein [Xanthobacteraceae bacterium]